MAEYVFIFHPTDNDIVADRIDLKFDDDLDALEAAEDFAEEYQVEFEIDVWTGERLVAQVKRGNAALNVNDAHSG